MTVYQMRVVTQMKWWNMVDLENTVIGWIVVQWITFHMIHYNCLDESHFIWLIIICLDKQMDRNHTKPYCPKTSIFILLLTQQKKLGAAQGQWWPTARKILRADFAVHTVKYFRRAGVRLVSCVDRGAVQCSALLQWESQVTNYVNKSMHACLVSVRRGSGP